jgi:hypothetical protein
MKEIEGMNLIMKEVDDLSDKISYMSGRLNVMEENING